jgi:SpoVK/Ycf46/Vps4 family AAA+-type ATPase
MAPIDDIRKRTEEGLKTLKETAQDIAFNVERQAMIGKRRYLDAAKLQRSIQRVNAEIGEYVYDQFICGKLISSDDPFIRDRMSSITRMRLTIRDIEDEIAELEKSKPQR